MSSPNHPTSDIEDAFSSNFPDYILASPDYFPASPGNTSSESLNNSSGLVPIASPTPSLFHNNPYMKVMQAYDAISPPQVTIPSPTVVPPSPVLSLSPMFYSRYFFPPEEIPPPKDTKTPIESPIPISLSSSVGYSSPVRSTTPPPDYPFDDSIFADLDNSLWIIPRPLGSEPVPEESNEVMSSPNHPTSDIKDAFSSNFPDYIPASPDYFPASPGNTSSESSNISSGLVLIASPTLSLFHNDPYMKVMQAYDAINPPQVTIPPPTIVPLSPVLSLSPMFDSRDFFPPKEIPPPKDTETPVKSPILISPSSSV
ncbi:hypothetical protein Tco_0587426 [Tanacetum coccineum]